MLQPKKKKRSAKSDFIIDEAEVDDDMDEDDEAWDDAEADDLANEAEEAGRTARDIEAKMRGNRGEHGGFGGFGDDMNAEEIEEYYRKRYTEDTDVHRRFGKLLQYLSNCKKPAVT